MWLAQRTSVLEPKMTAIVIKNLMGQTASLFIYFNFLRFVLLHVVCFIFPFSFRLELQQRTVKTLFPRLPSWGSFVTQMSYFWKVLSLNVS